MSKKEEFLAQYGHDDHTSSLINGDNERLKDIVLSNENAGNNTLHEALKHPEMSYTYWGALTNKNLSPDHINHVLKTAKNPTCRIAAIEAPRVSKDNLINATKDMHPDVSNYAKELLDNFK